MSAALSVIAPGRLEVRDVVAKAPGAGETTVGVVWAGVCHTDLLIVAGQHPRVGSLPHIPGHEIVGVVRAVGEGVAADWVGKRVAVITQIGCGHCRACLRGDPGMCADLLEIGSSLPGGWQHELQVPVGSLVELPDSLSLRDASLIEPSANALSATRRARIVAGDRVAIIGPGAIGQLALGHARRAGAGRIVMVGRRGNVARLSLAASRGADAAVGIGDDEHTSAAEVVDALGGLADVVLQCAGSIAASKLGLAVLGPDGRLVLEGYAGDNGTMPFAPDRLVTENSSISGVRGWTIGDFTDAIETEAAETGPTRLAGVPIAEFDLEDFAAALELMHETSREQVKVAFRVQPESIV